MMDFLTKYLEAGSVSVVSGVTNAGKTVLFANLARDGVMKGKKSLLLSINNSCDKEIQSVILASGFKLPYLTFFRSMSTPEVNTMFKKVFPEISLVTDYENRDYRVALETIRHNASSHDVVLIDYLQCIQLGDNRHAFHNYEDFCYGLQDIVEKNPHCTFVVGSTDFCLNKQCWNHGGCPTNGELALSDISSCWIEMSSDFANNKVVFKVREDYDGYSDSFFGQDIKVSTDPASLTYK